MRILSFGSLNYDYVYGVDHFHVPKETLAAQTFYRNFGGKGLNQSIAMAKAGLEVYHAGRVGADGQPFIDFLLANGVNADLVLKDETMTTGHAIIEVCNAQNRILLYGGANQAVDEAQADEVLAHYEAGDYLVLQNEISCTAYLMKKAKAKGLKIFFNAAPMGPEVLEYPLELVDILCVNEIEGAALLEMNSSRKDCAADDSCLCGEGAENGKAVQKELRPKEIAMQLHERYPETCILLTAGEDGSYYCGADGIGCREADGSSCSEADGISCNEADGSGCSEADGILHVPARVVQAVDTTAAGDTYSGYYLAGISRGMDVRAAMELATKASSMTVQKPGAADSVPVIGEVLAE